MPFSDYEIGRGLGIYTAENVYQRYIRPRLIALDRGSREAEQRAYRAGRALRRVAENTDVPTLDVPMPDSGLEAIAAVVPEDAGIPRLPDILERLPGFDLDNFINGLENIYGALPDIENIPIPDPNIPEIPEGLKKGFREGFVDRVKRNTKRSQIILSKSTAPSALNTARNFSRGVFGGSELPKPGDPVRASGRGYRGDEPRNIFERILGSDRTIIAAANPEIGTIAPRDEAVDAAIRIVESKRNFEGEERMPRGEEVNLVSAIRNAQPGQSFRLLNMSGDGMGQFLPALPQSSSRSVRNNPASTSSPPDDETPLLESSTSSSSSSFSSSGENFSIEGVGSSQLESVSPVRSLSPSPRSARESLSSEVEMQEADTASLLSSTSRLSMSPRSVSPFANISSPPSPTASSSSSSSRTSVARPPSPSPSEGSGDTSPLLGSPSHMPLDTSPFRRRGGIGYQILGGMESRAVDGISSVYSRDNHMPALGSSTLPGGVGPQSYRSTASPGDRLYGNLDRSGVGSSTSQQPSFFRQAREGFSEIFSGIMEGISAGRNRRAGYSSIEMGGGSMSSSASLISEDIRAAVSSSLLPLVSVSTPPSGAVPENRPFSIEGEGNTVASQTSTGTKSRAPMDKGFMGLMGAQMGLEFLNSSINQITAEAGRDVQLMASSQQQAELNEENNAQADQNRHSEGLQWLQMRRGSRRF